MPQSNLRAHATQICNHLLAEGGIIDRAAIGYEPLPLENAWPLFCSSIASATQSDDGERERDLDLLRRLLRAGVIPHMFSIVLDYPAPPASGEPGEVFLDCAGVWVDLDACVWYGSLGALSSLKFIETTNPTIPEATQPAMEWRRMIPRIVQWLLDTTPWLGDIPSVLKEEGFVWKWCLDIVAMQIRTDGEGEENPTQGYLESAISLIFALTSDRSGVRGHGFGSALSNVALMGQLFRRLSLLRVDPQTSRLMPSPVVGDRIVGITFADLLRHIRDMAREMRSIMEPAECYRLEVHQMSTLSSIIFASSDGQDIFNPRAPALTDAFASDHFITYSASLMRDPRAELLRTFSSTEPLFSFGFEDWGAGIFSSWSLLIRGAWLNGDSRLAVEIVDSNFMFILERWSFLGPVDLDLALIDDTAICALESLRGDQERHRILRHQLAVIGRRISDHPDSSPELREIWVKARMGPSLAVDPPKDICSCVGCISLEDATLRCSKCKNQTYCSKTCQKTDWKAHKRRCMQSA